MLRNILSVIVGLISSFLVIQIIEVVGFKMYPPPANMNYSTPDTIKQYIANAPSIIFILVIIGYALGSLIGGFVSSLISLRNKMTKAITVGGILFGLGAYNLLTIPHPGWVIICALAVFLPMAYAGGFLGVKVSGKKQKQNAA